MRPGLWWAGARPPTLGAGAVPVAVGAAASAHPTVVRTGLALAVAVGLQVGVNYANDWADGVRGVDTVHRAGPTRLVSGGLASPRSVATAAAVCLAIAAAAGLVLSLMVQPLLILVGAAAIAAAVLYSAGPRPYGARALGEVSVFVFFGPVATCGTSLVETGSIPRSAVWASVPVGLLAVAILVVNNLRDIATDASAGKRTLAVRIGDRRTRALYAALVVAAIALPLAGAALRTLPPATALVAAAAPLAAAALRRVDGATGRDLVPALLATARLHLAVGLLLAAGLALT